MSHTLFVLYGQFYKVLHFPVFFLLTCCFSACFSPLLKGGNVAIAQHSFEGVITRRFTAEHVSPW